MVKTLVDTGEVPHGQQIEAPTGPYNNVGSYVLDLALLNKPFLSPLEVYEDMLKGDGLERLPDTHSKGFEACDPQISTTISGFLDSGREIGIDLSVKLGKYEIGSSKELYVEYGFRLYEIQRDTPLQNASERLALQATGYTVGFNQESLPEGELTEALQALLSESKLDKATIYGRFIEYYDVDVPRELEESGAIEVIRRYFGQGLEEQA